MHFYVHIAGWLLFYFVRVQWFQLFGMRHGSFCMLGSRGATFYLWFSFWYFILLASLYGTTRGRSGWIRTRATWEWFCIMFLRFIRKLLTASYRGMGAVWNGIFTKFWVSWG